MNKRGNNIYKYLLIALVIICYIFRYKTIYLESNKVLEISVSNILYPLTFLFTLLILEKNDFKETHKTIITTSIIYLISSLLITILINIPASLYSKDIDIALKSVFTPNYLFIKDSIIYYPNLVDTITFILLFYFSHTLITILYDAIKVYVKKFTSISLSMFIPYTLDIICFTTIHDTLNGVDLNTLIIHLTSNFVIVIISTLIVSLILTLKKVRIKS